MSISARDLVSRGDLSKMNDKCFESKFNCQKQITFTPRQHQLEGPGFKNIFQKKVKEHYALGLSFSSLLSM